MATRKQSPLDRYVSAMEAVATSPIGLSLSEIARMCGLPIATTHRLVQSLQKVGMISGTNTGNKQYHLGSRLLRLLHAGSDGAWLQISAQSVLDRLADEFHETCFLTRLTGRKVISIAWAVPERGLQSYVFPGHAMPPHAAASAKAILAYQSEELLAEILREPLPRLTALTKTDPAAIRSEYARVREQGYATCWSEMEANLGALAVPIPLPNVGVIYSLGVSGLINRLEKRPLLESLQHLRAASDKLSPVMGHQSLSGGGDS